MITPHTGRPTRERMATSRTVPSATPAAASSRGITPVKGPRATTRSWAGVQRRAVPSTMVPRSMAAASPSAPASRRRLAAVSSSRPSGRYLCSKAILPFQLCMVHYMPPGERN